MTAKTANTELRKSILVPEELHAEIEELASLEGRSIPKELAYMTRRRRAEIEKRDSI